MHRTLLASVATFTLAGLAPAQGFTLSEMLIDPPGTDQGQESIEIRGPASLSLAGYFLLVIEGDGTAAGVLDTRVDLSAYSLGSNGLLLIRDTSAVLLPGPDVLTNVVVVDFTPDIENGTNTYVLGFGTPPAVTTDLDTDNNGVLDAAIPGFTVVDAVSSTDGGATDLRYAAQLGGYDIPNSGRFTPDAYIRIYDAAGAPFCWTVCDVLAASTMGPYDIDFPGGDYQGGLVPAFGPTQLTLGAQNGSISLCSDTYGISQVNGGSQRLTVDAGVANAGKLYLYLGTLSGTGPGVPFPPVNIPLNFDPYFDFTLGNYNTPLLTPSIGTLDAQGRATATFTLGANGPLAPTTVLHHAVVVIDLTTFAPTFVSTPAPVTIQ